MIPYEKAVRNLTLVAVAALAGACTEPATAPPGPDSPISSIPDSRRLPAVDPLADELRRVDPTVDGWETERLNDMAAKQLRVLRDRLEGAADQENVEVLVDPGFRCNLLRPADRREAYSFSDLRVRRGVPGSLELEAAAGLERALQSLLEPLTGDGDRHAELKIIAITPLESQRFETDVLFHLTGGADGRRMQINATWKLAWSLPDGADAPRLSRLEVARYDESEIGGPLFSDCTESMMHDVAAYPEQFCRGTDDWCARIDFAARMNQYAHNGLAVGDVDGDGLDDVYLCQNGGLPDRLLRQNPDGSVSDISAAAGVDWLNESRSALIVDLDNDGAQDLLVATLRDILILRGDGEGGFESVGGLPVLGGYSLAAADYDGDRDLDVYVSNYLQTTGGSALPAPYHDANNGPANVLFRNLGGFRFEDATAAVGLDHNNRRFSYAASWVDHDEDGDLDLYVANDFGRNNLYRNEGGRFRDVAAEVGLEDMAAGMGTSWGDYDGDGRLDVYVSNMFSSAGRRIAYQRQFNPAADAGTRVGFQRHARGNSLFRNLGDGTFRDVTEEADVWMGRWAWGAQFADLNNDGLEDIFVPNGFFTNEDNHDL